MPIANSYPSAASIDADDTLLGWVGGQVKQVPGSVARTFSAPSGLVDAEDQTALSESVLNAADAATGWASFGGHGGGTPAVDTVNKTTGTGSIKLALQTTVGVASKMYYTFTSPQAIGTRTLVAFDLRITEDGPTHHPNGQFSARVADGVTISAGNMNDVSLAGVPTGSWVTVTLPLEGLTEIKSIGVVRVETAEGGTLNRSVFNIDNVRFIAETQIDQALGSTANSVAWVPPSYTPSANQFPLAIPTGKGLVDPARGVYSKANNVVWLHDILAHVVGAETGETDVAFAINEAINAATYGQTVKASPGAIYRFDEDIIFRNSGVTLDFTGAICFLTYTTNTPFFTFDECSHVEVVGGLWLGYYPRTQNAGSLLTTVAGSPTVSGTTTLLDALDEEVKTQVHGSWNNRAGYFARHMPQQLGDADDGLGPRWYFSFVLSDTAQVAGDCVIRIYDDDTDELLETETLTLTGTPTSYRVSHVPDGPMRRARVQIKKATGTANTITITSQTLYGENEYQATYDIASGFLISNSGYVTMHDLWIEGFGGDAIQISDGLTHHVHNYRFRSHACRRQGASYNQGTDILLEDFAITAPGRSGLDFEPFAATWFTRHVVVRNGWFEGISNYAFAMTNWSRNFDYTITDIEVGECGIGVSSGGFVGGVFRNIVSTQADNTISISGMHVVVENIYTKGRITGSGASSAFDDGSGSVTYEPENNVIRNVYIKSTASTPLLYILDGWRFEGSFFQSSPTFADFTHSGNNAIGPIRFSTDAGTDFSAVNVGEWHEQFPNTFKAPFAHSSVWMPGGWNHYADPVYNVASLSGTTTKGNNLRGVAAAVTQTATSLTVTFPTKTVGTLTSFTVATTAVVAGSLTPSTTYYYRVAPRGITAGPGTFLSEQSTSTGANTAIQLVLNGTYSHAAELITAGFTVLRGTVSGTYTTRYDVIPSQPFYGLGTANLVFQDTGAALIVRDIVSDVDRAWGYASSRGTSSGLLTPTDQSGHEPDTNYGVVVTPSWLTTVRVTSKTTAGFTIDFGTAAPSGATVDWFLVR